MELVPLDSKSVQILSSPPLSPDSLAFVVGESHKKSHTTPVTETPEKRSFVDKVSLDSFPTQTIEPTHSSSPRKSRRPRRKAKCRRSVGVRGSSASSDSTNSGGLDNFPASKSPKLFPTVLPQSALIKIKVELRNKMINDFILLILFFVYLIMDLLQIHLFCLPF